MAKTLIVGGYGPGISSAVAEKFGAAGFSLALVARNGERLDAGVKALQAKGIRAAAFPADLGDANAVKSVVAKARESLGPIAVLQWTAYTPGAGDLLTADTAGLHTVFDVAVTGLLTAVQESLPDLRIEKDAAVLVTNGGLGLYDPKIDALAVQWGAAGLAIANAAKHKLVGLLAEKLRSHGVYVGEVMVHGIVKGTAFDSGNGTIEPQTVANKFWELYSARNVLTADVS
jgi:NADP-dependent 3-hydroxy acid dehydrogenase YdfG